MATDLAPPDSNEGARVAVGAAPGQDVAIGGLHNGEDMAGALPGSLVRKSREAVTYRTRRTITARGVDGADPEKNTKSWVRKWKG
ncbi:hypothetical protein N7509_001383 [Penicillium cosmopolitanum]|uniref:Uncharacterized protein n=1 Tax=Penicillium cosmopolitanum TaxID=1131564 RepID=A0A9W9WC62_9EURO|nr:uncharacterized protein N7509_001383 [Penicillium cosmopolitanum]KAJ5414756.1 hypothetical protein N7509_001383 [Penicillium cosmopolitanum]